MVPTLLPHAAGRHARRTAGGMKVLVACEYSGTVRDAFIARGHDAMSCDLLPTEAPGPHHEGDVRDVINFGWDLVVAHPPCTYLANSGARWLYERDNRWQALIDGACFFRELLDAPAPRVAVENPIMHEWARKIVGRGPDQTIQPYEFGHAESKRTGLWLRGLPRIVPTDNVEAEMRALPDRERSRVHYASPGPDRWKVRSTFYAGVAEAMAYQWGALLGVAA